MAKQAEVRQRWCERVAEQEASGLSVRAYCKEHGLGEHSFYSWRQRLRREPQPLGFALVEAKRETQAGREVPMAELLLGGGERLRVPCEEAALGVVLRALRALG